MVESLFKSVPFRGLYNIAYIFQTSLSVPYRIDKASPYRKNFFRKRPSLPYRDVITVPYIFLPFIFNANQFFDHPSI